MTRRQKNKLCRIAASAVLLVAVSLLPLENWIKVACYVVPYLLAGYDVLWSAVRNILRGQLLDEKFLMAAATVGAFAIGEYPEAVFVMVFFQVGEWFENLAVGRSRRSIAGLMDIRPDYANVEREGELLRVDPEDVDIGDIIVIKPGEKIPLDGVVTRGESSLNTTALTGEAMPRDVGRGDAVISGCINLNGLLHVQVTKPFGESTVSKILTLVEQSAASKSRSENFITRFAHYYTPIVVVAALLLGIVPPFFVGEWSSWIHRALIFLVVSCPCALVISVPLSFFGGLGGAGKQGILIKGSNYMDALAQVEIVVLDKTGTLTKGNFAVADICPAGMEKAALLELTALAELHSDHPIALSIREAWGKETELSRVSEAEVVAGQGVKAVVDGRAVLAGNLRLMAENGFALCPAETTGTVVYVAVDGVYAGYIVLADEAKSDAAETIRQLNAQRIRTVMLTGDKRENAETMAEELGIRQVYAELMPWDKVRIVEELLEEKNRRGKLVFVGDGINDAPVLSRADVGIARGALGSDAAIEAADIVLMDDKPSRIVRALSIARRTRRIVTQNIVFALGVKALVMLLAVFNVATMWEASFADVGVCVLAILNAMRALK